MELCIENLTKRYGKTIAIDKVSVILTPGVWGLLGANGAGKTTLMKTVCMLLNPNSGTIHLDKRDIKEAPKVHRSRTAYLPQHFGVDSEFTVIDYMYYMAGLKGFTITTAQPIIDKLLDEMALSSHKKTKMRNLSGGMQRRLGIAQALINSPDLLILDEPTVGLDPKERVKFREILSNYANNKIVLLSTHIVSDVEFLANNIIIMHNGKIISIGTPEELCNELNGYVWQVNISRKERDQLENTCIVNIKNMDADTISVRYVSKESLFPSATTVTPTLEDAYMWYHIQEESK